MGVERQGVTVLTVRHLRGVASASSLQPSTAVCEAGTFYVCVYSVLLRALECFPGLAMAPQIWAVAVTRRCVCSGACVSVIGADRRASGRR